MPNILIIEASPRIRNSLKERLEYEKYSIEVAENTQQAAQITQKFEPDVILCDSYDTHVRNYPFIVLANTPPENASARDDLAAACDLITKPIDMNRLLSSIKKAMDSAVNPITHRQTAPILPRKTIRRENDGFRQMIGASTGIRRVKDLIDRVAPSEARVLITGHNGTGKEMVARILHQKSQRAQAPFVEINCAAIPSELIESELFGHEKGAFTSAIKQRKGKFEQAHGGTLFMDEIGDMSPSAQAKVLRALQEGRISRVGSDKDIEVDVRVVAATNKNMKREIERGAFREDLYHRLSVILIHVPPLAERKDDIPLLIQHFIHAICLEYGIPRKTIAKEGVEELCRMPWHGNVRELRNVVERLIVLSGQHIQRNDVQAYVSEFVF